MDEKIYISELLQTKREYELILKGQLNNEQLAQHCEELAEGARVFGEWDIYNRYINRATSSRLCHKTIIFDKHPTFRIAIYKNTMHCRDRFCFLCNKLISNSREKKFVQKVLPLIRDDYEFYHMVLTSPNSVGDLPASAHNPNDTRPYLYTVVRQMSKAFGYLNNYLKGKIKIAGLDFDYLGYAGAVRSFELTYKPNQEYHQHYHVIVAFKKDLILQDKHLNKYSYSRQTDKVTFYSDFEVLLQKIWYLLINGQKVTKIAIDSLELGYSCQCKHIDDNNFHQVFKYPFKPEEVPYIDFATFSDLDKGLRSIRTIQTYGCFHGLKIEDDSIDDNELDTVDRLKIILTDIDTPYEAKETPMQVKENIELAKWFYLSFKEIHHLEKKTGHKLDDATLEKLVETLSAIDITPQEKKEWIQSTLNDIKQKYAELEDIGI
ncbi:MAG: protein rep [Firmicutes bacterium]|nr:protein rep [Bacillota bacterium]